MNRPKPNSTLPPAPPLAAWPEPPTKPGIYTKHLPDGREVPWIVLSNPDNNPEPTTERNARGCQKCTT
ncbi:MAG: hypothetical protein LH606_18305 [Cytophagaceae bacterium]|nr:hypothetical protein [Cytophagaceae bacterium]